MKRISVIVIALGLAVSLFSIANAGNRNGMGGGCGDCIQQARPQNDQFRKFQADTIDLRQEMMTKRFDLQRENLKATPDAAKIAALKADIKVLQSKISDIRSKSGLPVGKGRGECGQRTGGCGNRGMAACNSAPCGSQK